VYLQHNVSVFLTHLKNILLIPENYFGQYPLLALILKKQEKKLLFPDIGGRVPGFCVLSFEFSPRISVSKNYKPQSFGGEFIVMDR
jgi:hypothetical protein